MNVSTPMTPLTATSSCSDVDSMNTNLTTELMDFVKVDSQSAVVSQDEKLEVALTENDDQVAKEEEDSKSESEDESAGDSADKCDTCDCACDSATNTECCDSDCASEPEQSETETEAETEEEKKKQEQQEKDTKALDKIKQTMDKVGFKKSVDIKRKEKQLENQLARLTLFLWKNSSMPQTDNQKQAKDIMTKTDRLAYEAGLQSEALFRATLELDCLDSLSSPTRTERKKAIKALNQLMTVYDRLRERALRYAKVFHDKITSKMTPPSSPSLSPSPSPSPVAADASNTKADVQMAASGTTYKNKRNQTCIGGCKSKKKQCSGKGQNKDQSKKKTDTSDTNIKTITRRVRLSFDQHRMADVLVLSTRVDGFDTDSITVKPDPCTRILTLTGTRTRRVMHRKPRRHNRSHPLQSQSHPLFDDIFAPASMSSVSSMFGGFGLERMQMKDEYEEVEVKEWFSETLEVPRHLVFSFINNDNDNDNDNSDAESETDSETEADDGEVSRVVMKDGVLRVILPYDTEYLREQEEAARLQAQLAREKALKARRMEELRRKKQMQLELEKRERKMRALRERDMIARRNSNIHLYHGGDDYDEDYDMEDRYAMPYASASPFGGRVRYSRPSPSPFFGFF